MYGSDWLVRNQNLVALSFALNLCAAVVFIGFWLDSSGQKASAEIQRYSAYCTDADARYRAFLSKFPQATTASENSPNRDTEKYYREQQTHWCDLLAQQTSAEATADASKDTAWVTWLTGAGIFLLGWTLLLTRQAVKEAEHATEAIVKEQRPWIKIKTFGIDTDEHLPFVVLENVGRSPSVQVDITAAIFVRPEYDLDFSDRIKMVRQCASQNLDHAVLPGDVGRFILPYDLHRFYEDSQGITEGGAHMYCVVIDYKGTGCEAGFSFGVWHAVDWHIIPDKYEEEERARQYT